MSDPQEQPHLVPVHTTKDNRRLLWGNAIKNLPPPQPLVESEKGLLDLDTTAIIYGGWGQYKSFLAMDLAFCVATGHPFWGHRVHQGNVLYVVGEGYTGTGIRLEAWQEYHGITLNPPVAWLDGVPHLINPTGRRELLDVVEEVQPVLTIIDTVARGITGAPENDSMTMGHVIETLDEIKRINTGLPIGVHHAGRASTDDKGNQSNVHARGHSGLDAGVDTILQMHQKQLYVEKQKHHEDHYAWGTFDVVPVAESIILQLKVDSTHLTPNQEIILIALRALGGEAPNTDLKRASSARGCKESSFDYSLGSLVKAGLVVKVASVASKPLYRLP